MRVGVRSGLGSATDGGGWTFATAVSAAIRQAASPHTFLWLEDEPEAGAGAPERRPRASGWKALRSRLGRGFSAGDAAYDGLAAGGEVAAWNGIARRHALDVVWFMSPPGLPLDVPYIATVWDLEHRKQPYFPEVSTTGWTWPEREASYRATLPRAAYVITGTAAGKEEIERFYGVAENRIRIIPFPVPQVAADDQPEPHVLKACAAAPNFLVYPAQYWPHKNHINLLHGLRRARDEGRDVKLVLTGSDKGNKSHVEAAIDRLRLRDDVVDLGFISYGSLCFLYRHAMALVFPSFFGPDNLPPLEAFGAGCPVLAADLPGVREDLGKAALYFDPTRPAEIAAAIGAVCDEATRATLIHEGRLIAASRSPERYAAAVQSLLDDFQRIRRCWGASYIHT